MAKSDKQQPAKDRTAVFRFKVGACMTGPTKRLVADLDHIAAQLNRIRNSSIRLWVRYKEDHPEFTEHCIDNGVAKLLRDNAAVIAPEIAAKLRNAAGDTDVTNHLKAKLPYTHRDQFPDTSAKYRWQAILANEVSPPSFRQSNIYVPTQNSCLAYNGSYSDPSMRHRLLPFGADASCLLAFPLFSRDSGREHRLIVCRLIVRRLTQGHKRLLQKVISGDSWKYCDSTLIKEDGVWYFNLTYRQPPQHLGLDVNNVATLFMDAPNAERPFRIVFNLPESQWASANMGWRLGDGRMLTNHYHRLNKRRLQMKDTYKGNAGADRAHGRRRFFRNFVPLRKGTHRLQKVFCFNMIDKILEFCKRNNCGQIIYREPGMGLRKLSWLAARNVPFDWTRFEAMLTDRAKFNGIELKVARIGTKDWKANLGVTKIEIPEFLSQQDTTDITVLYDPNVKKRQIRKK